MSLFDWANIALNSKIKQFEIFARSGSIKLKADGANFYSWLEENSNHCNTAGVTSILKLKPVESKVIARIICTNLK